MNKLTFLKDDLSNIRPAEWKSIPGIELYMDQVISYMKRQHIGIEAGDEVLTSAMINNYIKKGMIPRANGKRYNESHIAYMTAICLFKQLLTVDQTDTLLKLQLKEQDIEQFYKKYCTTLDEALSDMAGSINEDMDAKAVSDLILELAVSAYTQKFVCERLLDFMAGSLVEEDEDTKEEPPKSKKKK